MRLAKPFFVAAAALPLALAHCSSADAPATGPSSYRGVLTGDGDVSGTFELAGDTDLTGAVTLNVPGTPSVAVTGTVAADKTVQLTGSSMQFTGTLDAGVISGSYTSPWGVGRFSAGPGTGSRSFCGQFDGQLHGRWSFYVVNGVLGGAFAAPGVQGLMLGTGEGDEADGGGGHLVMHLVGPGGLAEGILDGVTASGGWTLGDQRIGSFVSTESECTTLIPAGTRGDGGPTVDFDAHLPPPDDDDAASSDAGPGDARTDGASPADAGGEDAGSENDAGDSSPDDAGVDGASPPEL